MNYIQCISVPGNSYCPKFYFSCPVDDSVTFWAVGPGIAIDESLLKACQCRANRKQNRCRDDGGLKTIELQQEHLTNNSN